MPKRVLRNLKLSHIAAVDNPCQEHARAMILKRAEPIEIGACVEALSQSIKSIVGDTSLTGGARDEKIQSSVGDFLATVSTISPEVSKQLAELVREKEMPKTVEELTAEVEKITGQLTSAEALVTSEKARADAAEGELAALKEKSDEPAKELAKVKAELEETKKKLTAATDEVIKVGETEVRKSEVGEASFTVTKALADERDLARFEKRASEELAHVVGKAEEKALVLKYVDRMPEDAKKAVEAIIQSAEKMAAQGFETLGRRGELAETGKAAVSKFETKVKEIAKRDDISEADAMGVARREEPELFAEYQDAQ